MRLFYATVFVLSFTAIFAHRLYTGDFGAITFLFVALAVGAYFMNERMLDKASKEYWQRENARRAANQIR